MAGMDTTELIFIASVLFLLAGWFFLRYLINQRRYFGIPWPPRSIIAATGSGVLIGTSFLLLFTIVQIQAHSGIAELVIQASLITPQTLLILGSLSFFSITIIAASGTLFIFLLKSEPGGRNYILYITPLSALTSFIFSAYLFSNSNHLSVIAMSALLAAVLVTALQLHDNKISLANKPMFRVLVISVLTLAAAIFPVFVHATESVMSTGHNLLMMFTRIYLFMTTIIGVVCLSFIASNRALHHLLSYRNFRNKMEDAYLAGGYILLIVLMEIGIRFTLNATFPQEVVTTSNEQFIAGYTFVLLVVYALFAITIISLSHTFIRPIDAFRNALNKTSTGDMNALMNVTRKDDIGELADAYNMMVYRLRDLQNELAETERQAAWSEMARQVAHEIKNPLTPMKLSIQHLYQQVEYHQKPIEEVRPLVKRITNTLIQEIDSLSNIATDFSKFARPVTEEFQTISVQSFMESILELYTHDNRIDFYYEPSDDDLTIHAAQDELKRVFINLFKNALEAGVPGGLIYIRTFRYNKNAVIEIADTGKGMDENVRKRIFVPNFSTKNSGTGLGLAISRKVIDAHKGNIRFASVPGLGTTFTVYLPLCETSSGFTSAQSA